MDLLVQEFAHVFGPIAFVNVMPISILDLVVSE